MRTLTSFHCSESVTEDVKREKCAIITCIKQVYILTGCSSSGGGEGGV